MSSAELLTNPGWRTHHARLRRSRSTPSWLDRASSCAIIAVAAASLAYCTIATPAYCRQPALSTRAGCSERRARRLSSCSRSSHSRPDPESTRCTSARRAGGVRAAVVTAQGQPREQLQWPAAYLRAQHLRQRAQTAVSVRARIAAQALISTARPWRCVVATTFAASTLVGMVLVGMAGGLTPRRIAPRGLPSSCWPLRRWRSVVEVILVPGHALLHGEQKGDGIVDSARGRRRRITTVSVPRRHQRN
jgi:hypothetical protein